MKICSAVKAAVLLMGILSIASARTFQTYSAELGVEVAASEADLIAVVNNPSAAASDRIEALDILSSYADPKLFQLFKDIAFRSADKELQIHATALLGSFVGTYRLPEMCDTLTDVFRNFNDNDIRLAAMLCLKDIAPYVPCDRNKIIGALLFMVNTQTYTHDARLFFNAVPFLVDMSAQSDQTALDMLDYLKMHYEEYAFDNLIDATDAYKTFTNSIGKTYREQVENRSVPSQINEMIPNAVTKDYITVIEFMLDSVATDSLGMSAITWLVQNGGNENGDEGERLGSIATIAPLKRPDKSAEILSALQPLLQKYGVHTNAPVPTALKKVNELKAVLNPADGTVVLTNLTPNSRITVFSINGKKLFDGTAEQACFKIRMKQFNAAMRYVVTVDRVPVAYAITR